MSREGESPEEDPSRHEGSGGAAENDSQDLRRNLRNVLSGLRYWSKS